MRLKLSNIAKIRSADIKLNGITVIAGKNNTGKSTIGKAVFSLFNSLVDIEDKVEKQKEKQIFQLLRRSMTNEAMPNAYRGMPRQYLMKYASELIQVSGADEYAKVLNSLKTYIADAADQEGVIKEIEDEIRKIKELPIDGLRKIIVSSYFNDIFYSEINNKYKEGEKTVVEAQIKGKNLRLEFSNNQCVSISQDIDIVNEAIYLDNPFVLNRLNGYTHDLDAIEQKIISKLKEKKDTVEQAVQYSVVSEKLRQVMEKTWEAAGGSVSEDEAKVYYYRDSELEKININNLSAGLKSFVIIKTLLEQGSVSERDVLILDEPEIHLHPEWQLIYAELIVLWQKAFDLTVILTTHSAHFLDALSFFARKHNITDKCNYYLSVNADQGCVLEDVTNDLDRIYSQLVDPSILLDRLKYEWDEQHED